jgi:protein-disulfide isomerase
MSKILIALATLSLLTAGVTCKKMEGTAEIDAKLDKVLSRLDDIEKKIGQGGGGQPPGPPMPKPGVAYQLPVDPEDAYRGGKHAKVTIVEAFEFACPYCAMVSPTLDQLAAQYKPDDLKIVQKHFIVHPDAATHSAHAACAAHRQGKFADFEKKLWHNIWGKDLNQPQPPKQDALSEESLKKLAKEVGMDLKQYDEDMKNTCPALVQKNMEQLIAVGVAGTPSIFINGVAYQGSRSVDGFKKVIDAEIAKADAALKGGATLETYYSELMKKAKPKIE